MKKYRITSIPSLNKFAKGGDKKGCPPGTYWNGTKCTKLYTLKNDKKYIDGVAAWDMHVTNNEVRNLITPEYNDQIKDRLYSGKWGFDPESGALIRLDKIQPQSVTKLDDKTKASREKEKKQQEALRNKWESEDTYRQSIIDAGFDPATFGKAKGTNVITGEPIYASSKEEADRINQEAINQAAIEGNAAVVNNPVFKAAAYMTPVGMAIGAMEGAARLAPDVYDFAKDPSWSGAGQIGMDVLQTAPFAGAAIKNAYKINPWAFKEDPNKFYRQIGNKGLEDALNTGVIKSADQATYPRPYFVEGKDISMLEQTGSGAHGRPTVMFETSGVNKEGMPFVSPANASGEYTPWIADMAEVPVSEGRLLKQHWLKGYKEVPTELPGSPNTSISGRLKQFFDRPPGPLMLGMPTGSSGNMVKKNMNYYKQLLDSYDGKKMSISDRKFYNSLIETGKKQDGMVTEAQFNELKRLETGNFNFGKRGYNKESLVQVEPKAPVEVSNAIPSVDDVGKKGYSLNFEQILKLPDEDILNKTGRSKEDWELFIEAKPDKYGKALEDTYNSAYNPTQEQLANIEAGKQQLLDFYSSGEYNRRLQNGIPGLSFMDAHNYQNNLINAINKTKPRYVKSKNSGTLESDAMAYSAGADASGTKLGIDFSSTGLSRPDSKYVVSHEYGHTSLYDDKNRKLLENLPKLSLDEETLKNWTKWGKESGNKAYDDLISYYSSPDEARQRGISAILYSKEAGISIDDLVDMPYNQVIELNRAGKIPKDIAELRQIYNQKELKDYLKKLYSIAIPTTGIIGTATMLANPFEGSNGLPQQKKGGSTNNYIELDIPKSKIKEYIDQGYIVEELD
jgi:hypothetical protein